MLVLLFSVLFTLAILINTTAIPHDGGSISKHPASTAVFGAMGTIIGYFGIEIGSDSLFERLLWPTRYYNTLSFKSLVQLMMLTPMGGPMLRPAIRVIDKFIAARMHRGKRQGDPLGTAFFPNLRQRHIIHLGKGSKETHKQDTEEFRNFIWVRVLRLVRTVDGQKRTEDPETAEHTKKVSVRRPVYLLDLTPFEQDAKIARPTDTIQVSGDVGTLRFRNVVGIFCSELVAVCTGCLVAIKLKTAYAILFFLPLILKLLSLLFSVRRQHLVWPLTPITDAAKETQFKNDIQMLELNRERDTDDFILIRGSEFLLRQFSRHYSHPLRDGKGILANDRTNEVVSMILVLAFAIVFPVSLFASIWADEYVQRIWLGYEAYATVAMYAFRFWGGEFVGSTEMVLAKGLERGRKVVLVGDDGKGVMASLQCWTVKSVAEGKEKVGVYLRNGRK